jgi:hypothetical protein
MDEIHTDSGRTVENLGRDPWLQIDWQGIFERVVGSSAPPVKRNTLVLVVSNKYGCERGFAETVIDKAAECGQLLRVDVQLEDMKWYYYIAERDVIREPCNWLCIRGADVFVDKDSMAPKVVSRDEIVERVISRPRQSPRKQIQYVADNIEHLDPFYVVDGDLKLQPRVAENILVCRSHAQVVEAVSFSTPKQVNEVLADVMSAVSDYNTAKGDLNQY